MAKSATQVIQDKLDALRKSTDVEVLKNRVRNYGQQALEAKRIKNATKYKEAKALQDKAQAELDKYNTQAADLIKQLQAADKLAKNAKTLSGVEKERQFYIDAGIEIPEDVQNKYDKLVNEKKTIKKGATETPKTDTGQADSDKDGIPDLTDNLPNYPNPDQKTGTGVSKKKPTTPTPTPGDKKPVAGEDTADDKQLWISYLRTVFDTLEDKKQKGELDRIFATAKREKWTEATFMENLKGTAWWQSTLPSLRQFLIESKDPRNKGMFAEKVKNNIDSITASLEDLGIARTQVDPVTGKIIDNTEYIKGLALKAIQNNWTDDQLQNWLATKGDFIFTGGGTIGSNYDRINQTAYLYGINLDDNMKKAINTSLLDPLDGRDAQYWMNSVKQMAMDAPQNQPFAEALKSGRSLYEVTSSYRNQMATLLEVDSTAITWDDLMGKVLDKESGSARTFADFTKALKQDPLWQYTRNAKETYDNMALDLGKMFGFVG